MQSMTGAARLVRVVADLGAALLAEQRLDGGIDVQNPRRVQSRLDAGQKLWPKPVPALLRAQTRQGPAQGILADDLAHTKNLRTDPVATQPGNMRVAVVAGQNRQQPGAQNVPYTGSVAAAVVQRTTVHPGLVDPGRGQKLGKKR